MSDITFLGRPAAFAVRSQSNPEHAHLVVHFMALGWRCSCPAGVREIPCRHIREVQTWQSQVLTNAKKA